MRLEQAIGRTEHIWYALELGIEAAAVEAVQYALMEAGALGTQLNNGVDKLICVTAYFSATPDPERVRAELAEALRIYDLPSSSARAMRLREVNDQDWLGEWRKSWPPVEVGRFIVAPPWSKIEAAGDRIVIRIEPGMAFGTGTHETTRLCLKAIQRFFKGTSFLDVGTGTGILAIAAAKFFPAARIEACDTDANAIEIARQNARLNEVAELIGFRVGSIGDDACTSADLVCANLTADAIRPLLPALIGASCRRLVLSGILESQLDEIVGRLRELNPAASFVIMQDGEWVAIVV